VTVPRRSSEAEASDVRLLSSPHNPNLWLGFFLLIIFEDDEESSLNVMTEKISVENCPLSPQQAALTIYLEVRQYTRPLLAHKPVG